MLKPGSSLIAMLLVAAQPLAVSQSSRGEECADAVPSDPWDRGQWDATIPFGFTLSTRIQAEHMVLLKNGYVLVYGGGVAQQCILFDPCTDSVSL